MTSEEQWAAWMRSSLSSQSADYHRLLSQMVPFLRKVALRRCKELGLTTSDAEDLVQDALIAIHLKRQTWDSTRPIIPWILAILKYKAIDHARQKSRRQAGFVHSVDMDSLAASDVHVVASIDINRMLGELSVPQREIVRQISLEGYSTRETANLLSMSEVAVRVSLHRSLKRLSLVYAV